MLGEFTGGCLWIPGARETKPPKLERDPKTGVYAQPERIFVEQHGPHSMWGQESERYGAEYANAHGDNLMRAGSRLSYDEWVKRNKHKYV